MIECASAALTIAISPVCPPEAASVGFSCPLLGVGMSIVEFAVVGVFLFVVGWSFAGWLDDAAQFFRSLGDDDRDAQQ